MPAKPTPVRAQPRDLPESDASESGTLDDLIYDSHLEDRVFTGLNLADTTSQHISSLIGTRLLFERCSFAGCEIGSVRWSDVRLVGCDLSNATVRHFEATRVEFIDCKMIGINAIAARWQDVLLERCDARFAQLSRSRIRRSEIRSTQLREAALNNLDLDATRLVGSVLRQADLAETPLKDVDLRSCEIEEIVLRVEDLRGAIVSAAQAMDLARLLGVVIR
jgi:uncharacterized protein YjbI with pentapeptide repeats